MSQKTLFAICVVASLVALVAAQSVDVQGCSKNARQTLAYYRADLTKALRKFTDKVQNSSSQTVDTIYLEEGIDKITQEYAQLINTSGGLDFTRFTSAYVNSLSTIASMSQRSLRLALVTGLLESVLELVENLLGLNTRFMESVTEACMPQIRIKPLA